MRHGSGVLPPLELTRAGVDPDALSSPLSLLNALRGAEVRAVGARELIGRLISVTEEYVQLPNNGGSIV